MFKCTTLPDDIGVIFRDDIIQREHIPVDPGPRGYQGQDVSNEVHKCTRRVTLVATTLPQLVQSCTSDHQRGVDFKTICTESWVLEKLL